MARRGWQGAVVERLGRGWLRAELGVLRGGGSDVAEGGGEEEGGIRVGLD